MKKNIPEGITEPVRLLVERTRREMNLTGSLRFNPGGKCSEGGATTEPHWDHWQIIHRQPRQRYHTARWTYFYWVPQDNRLYCRQKDFRFYFKDKTTELTPEIQERILNRYRRTPPGMLLIGSGGKFKGQWQLKRLRRPNRAVIRNRN